MRSKLFWLILISTTVICSCKKDSLNQPSANGLISKIITDFPDWHLIDSFVYDSQNRVTRWYKKSYDTSLDIHWTMYYDFHYNGNDDLPYKITDTTKGTHMNWWIQYDSLGRKIVDSISNFGLAAQQVSHYTYSLNRVSVNSIVLQTYGELRNLRDTFDYEGDNCVQYKGFNSRVGTSPYWWQYSMTHDNNVNPIIRLNIAAAVFFGGAGTMGLVGGLNKNNIITWTFTSSDVSLPRNVKTYQYSYDPNGNVTFSSATFSAEPTRFERVSYEYYQ